METIKLQDPKWYKLNGDCVSYLIDEYFFDKTGNLSFHSLAKREDGYDEEVLIDEWNMDWEAEGKIHLFDTYGNLDAVIFKPKRDAFDNLVEVLRNESTYNITLAYNRTHPDSKISIIPEEYNDRTLLESRVLRGIDSIREFLNQKR